MKKLLFAITMLLSLGIAYAQPYAQISYTQQPQPVIAGNSVILTISVTNLGPSYAQRIKIKPLYLEPPLNMNLNLPDNIGSLPVGSTLSYSLKVNVPSDAKSGFYTTEFQVSICDSSTCRDYTIQPIISVESPIEPAISLSVSKLPLNFNGTIYLLIDSAGSEIKSLNLKVENPVIKITGGSDQISIQDIKPGQKVKIPLRVSVTPTAVSGIYPFVLIGSYYDALGQVHYINESVNVKLVGNISFVVSKESQSMLPPFTKGSLTIRISNAGNEKAKFLTLEFNSTQFKIVPSIIYIGNLDSDDYDSEKVYLTPLVEPGNYKIKAKLIYYDVFGEKHEKTFYIPVEVSEKTENTNEFALGFLTIVAVAVISYMIKRKKK